MICKFNKNVCNEKCLDITKNKKYLNFICLHLHSAFNVIYFYAYRIIHILKSTTDVILL